MAVGVINGLDHQSGVVFRFVDPALNEPFESDDRVPLVPISLPSFPVERGIWERLAQGLCIPGDRMFISIKSLFGPT